MGRVGWATVIGCVLGVMLFGILQRGCDAEGTGGVEILTRESVSTDADDTPVRSSRRGLSVAPGPAPERAISGPTSPPRGTPRRMQVSAQQDQAAREAARSASDDQLEWLRRNREEALAKRATAQDTARAQRLARETAERLRRQRDGQATNTATVRTATPTSPSGGEAQESFVEQPQQFPNQQFDALRLPPPPGSFRDSFSSEGDTTFDGVAGESTAGNGGESSGAGGAGSITTRGTGGSAAPPPVDNGNGGGDDDDDDDNGGGVPLTPPAAPGLNAPADGAEGQLPTLTLSWASAARASTYTVQVSTSADFATLALNETGVNGTSFPLPAGAIEPGQGYFWRVLAVNAEGSAASPARSFSTLAAPASFSIVSPANNAPGVRTPLTLSWGDSQGADSYSVIVARDSAFSNIVFTRAGLEDTSIDLPDDAIDEGLQYWWRVIASNPAGSALAGPMTATFTTLGAPGAFTLVSPSNDAIDQFVPTALAWSPSRFAATYRVEVATDEAFLNRVVNRPGLTQPTALLTADDIEPGTTYWWRVTAENELDMTGSSQVFTFSTAPLPGEFSLTTPANNANIGAPVTLRWTESERALLYVVQVATDEDFTDLIVDEFVIPLLTGETAFSIEDGLLETGERYYWRIEAQNEIGVREAQTPVFSFSIRTTDFDINGDGLVDVRDLYAYHAASPTPDVNLDGQRNNDDRIALRNRIRQGERADLSEGRSN